MNESNIEFVSAGRVFGGLLVDPRAVRSDARSDTRPGVLVLHGGAGLGEHERERARMLAELGYVALAPDLFGERFESRARGMEVIIGLTERPHLLRERLSDALACLRAQPGVDASRLAAIGFCFGGLAALELARGGADVRCAVSFHGGLTTHAPALPAEVRAAVLVCTGAADPFVTREHRLAFEDEMTHAGADWQLHLYAQAKHGFTVRGGNHPGAEHHAPSDARSWHAMRALLAETLGG